MLSSPLRDRFGWVARLEYYPPADLVRILERAARIANLRLDGAAALEVARRSRGTPRIAHRLLRRVRDWAEVGAPGEGVVRLEHARIALEKLDVDAAGFDALDRALLLALLDKYDGGPVGIDTLAAALGEDRTPRGLRRAVLAAERLSRSDAAGARGDAQCVGTLRPHANQRPPPVGPGAVALAPARAACLGFSVFAWSRGPRAWSGHRTR